ncbi:hypothetical protein [Methylophilus sp. 3sh_L]|uniref:hypothetical protein n=1 Tax=Methylophilus sp. 3sh_L TaxID=3377114 RepID=UPI00398F8DB9
MAVTTLVTLNTSAAAASAEFTPTDDFYVAVDAGQVALEAKLPGNDKFYLVSSVGIDKVSPVVQAAKTIVKVTPYMTGTVYRLAPQTRKVIANVFKE